MTNNFKKFLLLSALTVQSFASVSYAATAVIDLDTVGGAAQAQGTSGYRLAVPTTLALAVSLGIDPTANRTTLHQKVDIANAALSGAFLLKVCHTYQSK